MEILESFDLTRCHWSAGALAGSDPKTVARYVAIRDAGADPHVHARRPRLIDSFLEKIEELVERSAGAIRADKVHGRLVVVGFTGGERTTQRAVAEAKAAYAAFHDLRHSHCAHLIAAGRNPKDISRRLGHASVSFTLDRYGHLMPDAGVHAAAAVAELVDGGQL